MASKFLRSTLFFAISFLFPLSITINSQTGFEKNDSSVTVFLFSGITKIQICSEEIIRILHSPASSVALKTSLSVNAAWEKTLFDILNEEGGIAIRTKKLTVRVDNRSGSVSIADAKGNLLYSEDQAIPALFTPVMVLGEKTHSALLKFRLSENEGIYGLGQFQDGVMNYRGHELVLTQENTQVASPFLLSTKRYGLLFDNYSKIRFRDSEDSTSVWFEVADVIDYYFIAGHDMDDVILGYRKATGEVPMFSRWAYGYFQSKERYMTQDELLNVAKEFRARKIPVDCLVQDWQYWGDDNSNWNAMRFDSLRYPDPRAMINILHEKYHTHLMVSIWPVAGQKTELYSELDSKGLLYKPYHWTDGRTYDAYSPEARRIYWNSINRGLFSKGVDAFWMDATEPEIVLAPTERSTKEAGRNVLGTMARYLNTYSLETTEAVYKGQRSVTSDKRVYILTRSAFLGQQRNAATTWSGDIVAGWKVFRNQISAGLNFCMSGQPYWTNDIGGFHVRRYGAFLEGCKDPGYRELYVRWYQFGVFNPIFRSHGTDTPREPWQFGEPGTWSYDALLRFDRLRYRLMPYIYSLGWKVTSESYTIMRGLPMDFPDDRKVRRIDDQYMFGPALMINPVTAHMYYGESYTNETIPFYCLRTPDGQTGGYRAEYFNGANFDTLLVDSVQSLTLFDLYLGKDLPPVVNWERNSMRWTGELRSLSKGEYEFWISVDDAVRFSLGGKLLLNAWNADRKDTTYRIKVNLQAEHWYPFKLEYARMTDATKLRLAWHTPEMKEKKFDPTHQAGMRSVYLPSTTGGWYDFWTGEKVKGGRTINRKTPIDIMPLYIRAGSILPMGPDVQYTSEKSTGGPIELRVYTGSDAAFSLYDDEGDNYNYEHGSYSLIAVTWNEKMQTLTIGDRKGSFPGMPDSLTFNIIWISPNHGTGIDITTKPDRVIIYDGKSKIIRKQPPAGSRGQIH